MQRPEFSSAALLEHLPPERSVAGLAWRFVPVDDQAPVLALSALVAAIGQIEHTVSDPGVALAKLAWWQHELSRAPAGGSQHPLLQALLDHPAAGPLDHEGLATLIGSVAHELEGPPAQSLATFRERELRRGGDEALLLAGLRATHPLAGTVREAASVVRMLGRLEALADGLEPAWLPLDLVARFQLRRSGPANAAAPALPGLVQALAEAAVDWWPADAWQRLEAAPELRASAPGRYWLLGAQLAHQRVVRWSRSPAFWLGRVRAPTLPEVWQAWKLARRIYRPGTPSR